MPRKQYNRLTTGVVQKRLLMILSAVITLLMVTALVYAVRYEAPYTPPPFESNARLGIPTPAENMRYGNLETPAFTFGIAATAYQQKDGSLKIYLTNHENNHAYLMCEVINVETEKVLYRSGLLRPGEYVESLEPLRKIENVATPIEIFVYALELDGYLSVGQVSIDNILQPG